MPVLLFLFAHTTIQHTGAGVVTTGHAMKYANRTRFGTGIVPRGTGVIYDANVTSIGLHSTKRLAFKSSTCVVTLAKHSCKAAMIRRKTSSKTMKTKRGRKMFSRESEVETARDADADDIDFECFQGIIGFNGHIQCADEKLENADAETSSKNDISTRRPLHWSDEAASQEVGSAEQDVVTAVSGCNTKIHDCVLDEQDTITIDWPKSVTNAVHPWHPLLSTDLNTDELWFLNGYTSSPDPLSLLTHACDDEAEQSWEQFLNHFCVASFKKIGEGTFSEVYETLSLDLSKVVLKVTPVEDCTAGGLKAKTFGSILPEVLIYKQIQTLAEGDRFSTPCFIGAEKVHLIRGKCPRLLTQAWNEFASKRSYYSVCPESFSERQHFIIVETSYGGVNLESFKFRRFAQAISVFVQITLSLAIAERVFFFEHRDLHVGNILIQAVPTQTPVQFVYRGQTMFVRSHGVKASIIDFSLSRINKGRAVIRTDLAADEDLFSGVGDYQFEIYRMMKQENGNNWSKFTPRSNVFWLHYLLRHLCERTQYPINSRPSRKRLRYMQEIIFPAVLSSGSATEVLEHQQLLELFAKEIDMWSE